MTVGNVQLVAGGADAVPRVLAFLEKEGVGVRGNPDLYVREYARFGIEEARELRSRASLKPMGERRVFVVATPQMTADAQNALLKTLEEPSANALFVFIVASPRSLLPTLRSRAQDLTIEREKREPSVDPKTFLAASRQKRLDMLKPLLEKDEDDRRDLRPVLEFLDSLERALARRPEALRPLYAARKYIFDKGALLKPLLEEVALLAPEA